VNAPAKEEWRVIADFPDYAVSNHGRVKRIAPDARGHTVTGACLKPAISRGRVYCHVSLCEDGKKKSVRVNRLVCEAFHGSAPSPRHHAAHNDGDASNNHAENLRWALPTENEADKILHGTAAVGERHWSKLNPQRRPRGERHGRTKLTEGDVRAIRKDTRSQREIARAYGVNQATIGRIRNGSVWGHVR
jgi:hypothetical protein